MSYLASWKAFLSQKQQIIMPLIQELVLNMRIEVAYVVRQFMCDYFGKLFLKKTM